MEDWHLKQAVYSTLDANNITAWRHKSKGPKLHWEGNLSHVLGDQWRYAALDRKTWRAARAAFVQKMADSLLGANSKLMGSSAEVNPAEGSEGGCKSDCQVLRLELGWAPDLMWDATHEGFRGGTMTTKCGQGMDIVSTVLGPDNGHPETTSLPNLEESV